MASNIVGCFDNPADARAVQQELIGAGIPRDHVHLVAEQQQQRAGAARTEEPGMWESIKEAFGFADERDRTTYQEAARRGGIIVSADVPDTAVNQAAMIMRRHNVIDLDQREAQWRQQGWAGIPSAMQQRQDRSARQRTTAAREGEEVIPVVEEQLNVGKREVQQGGVRVYSHITEKPVEQQVNLREEHVEVERRPADRPITAADRPFQERAIEATEKAEEPVAQKQGRVVEEVALRKEAEQRTETVRDTVRRTDVDVERIPGQQAAGGADISDAYINELSADARYRGRDWTSVEPEIRRSFEQRYPGTRWEQHRDRIRTAMERRRT